MPRGAACPADAECALNQALMAKRRGGARGRSVMPRRQAFERRGHVPGAAGRPGRPGVRPLDPRHRALRRPAADRRERRGRPPRRGAVRASWPTWSRPATRRPGVGLAAPQIGVNKRVAIIDLSVGADPRRGHRPRQPGRHRGSRASRRRRRAASRCRTSPRRSCVRRGCGSGPADASGAVREIEGTGLLARALCHETDHLNGMLFVDRLRGLKRELTWRKIRRQKEKGIW